MTTDKKVLVLDADSEVVLLCQSLLERRSYRFFGTTQPKKALEIIRDEGIDLLLFDIQLSGLDGVNFISQVRLLQPNISIAVLADNQAVETAIKMLAGSMDGLVIKPVEIGSTLIAVVEGILKNGQKKINHAYIQSLVRLGSTSLLNSTQRLLEKQVVEIFAETFAAGSAGIYFRPTSSFEFQKIASRGNLPKADDALWKVDGLQQFQITDPFFRWLISGKDETGRQDVLERFGWSSMLVISVRRREEQYLFLVARELEAPVFDPADLDWMLILAYQSMIAMENIRLFSNVAGLVRRIEKSGGILQQAEKMNVLEKVLPALIHEVNNPLQSIKNNLYLAGRPGTRNDRMGDYLTAAQKELYRTEGMLQRLLFLIEPVVDETVELELEGLVKQTLNMLAFKLRDGNIVVRTSYSRPLPGFKGERSKIEQVLLMILFNSVEALAAVDLEKVIWIDARCENDFVQIVIEDNGKGIPESICRSLMKPYVTSKPNGLGMGLVVSQRIVEAHGGTLSIIPARRGGGACIEICLPAAAKNA